MDTKTNKSTKFVIYILLGMIGIFSIFPLLWMLSTSLKNTHSLYIFPPEFIPKAPTIENYIFLFRKTAFLLWLRNSTFITVIAIGYNLFFSSLAGYVFAKMRFIGKNFLFILLLGTTMIPYPVLLVPVFVIFSHLKLINTFTGLIIPGAANAFIIFVMRQYILTIPDELIDAAKMDGASDITIFLKIILPLCKPALAIAAIFAFLWTWNSFIWPLILAPNNEYYTLQIGLALFQSYNNINWGIVMTGAVLSFLPQLILYLLLQRYFITGITLTGLKG